LIAGVEHVGGDMFESVTQGDAILMMVGIKYIASLNCPSL